MKRRNLPNNVIMMKTRLLLATLCVCLFSLISRGQIYKHDFGSTTITTNPYTVAPGTLNAQLSTTSWTSSTGSLTSYAGSAGQALSLANSGGTPTLTLKFTVQSGYEASITSFNFWRQRSSTGAANWSMRVNSTIVGSGTAPTSGAALGQTNVTNAVSGLTGTVSVIISLSGATGTGTFRLDDFTLNGAVTQIASACSKPTAILSSNIKDTSADISWTAATGSPSGYEYAVTSSPTPPASGAATTNTGISVSGLAASTKHYIHLRTACSSQFSDWVKDSFTTIASPCSPVSVNNPQSICSGGSYIFNSHTYTIAATYYDTLQTADDCDSIIVTQLSVNPTYSINNPQSICAGGSYVFNGHTYTMAATYYDTLQTVAGCDSIITTQLSVNPTYSVNNPQNICAGGSYVFNGHTYAIAATYYDTLQTVAGCDSIITTQLTVNQRYNVNNPRSICSGGSYTYNAHTYSIAGIYYDTLQTINGCDSIIVTQLTVNQVYNQNNPQQICSGGSYVINSHTYTMAGTYRDTLQSVSGCDSIIVTQLSVGTAYNINNPQQICTGSSYVINAHTYTTAGIYRDTFPSVTGCDSIVITQLGVNQKYSVNNPRTICNGGSYVINAHTYTTAGNYRDTLYSVSGCDSIIVTQLTVNPTYSTNNPRTICSGGSYVINTHTYTTAGTYRDTLQTVNGCDSIIVTQLTVNPAYNTNNPRSICSGGSYVINAHTYTTAGTYRDTLQTASGCDSIIVTQLTVNTAPGITSQPGNITVCGDSAVLSIAVTGSNTLYQWLPVGGGSTVNGNTVKHDRVFPVGTISKADFSRKYVAQLSNTCGTLYSDTLIVTYFTNIWTGTLNSNVNNAANWACGTIPSAQVNPKNLVVPKTAANNPLITGTFTFLYADVDSGRTLTISGANDTLNIEGSLSLAPAANYNGANGTTQLGSNGSAVAVTLISGTYYNLNIKSLAAFADGNTVIKNNILSAAPIRCTGNLVIDSNATYTIPKVITEGTSGRLTIRNIGVGGRTGAVLFPVSANASGSHPIEITNTGVADEFNIHVIDSVTDTYTGNVPSGAKLTASAVNKTWIINEGVAGGSVANLKVSWNSADELAGFTRSSSYVAHHNGTRWTAGTAAAASGAGPYSQTLSGVTSFSPFGVGSGGVLPVSFISLTASRVNDAAAIRWTTAQEINNDFFIVERSTDGRSFVAIGKVKGAGNSAIATSYTFTDAEAGSGKLYYRLKQVDFNGASSHSDVAVLTQENKAATRLNAVVYPNPSSGASSLLFTAAIQGAAAISIFNIQGKPVHTINHEPLQAGDQTITLPQLGSGVYFIRITHNNQSQTIKLVVN